MTLHPGGLGVGVLLEVLLVDVGHGGGAHGRARRRQHAQNFLLLHRAAGPPTSACLAILASCGVLASESIARRAAAAKNAGPGG